MKIATMINSPGQAIADSARLEALGYDALFTNESRHDPFVLSTLVAERTSRVEIMTYIAVAFARTPMIAAASAYDVNLISKGRFTLGLGSQIKAHVERRFSMPWSHPAPRMKEFVQALHAIWDTWEHGKPLQFEGAFYRHTLTSPTFIPQDHSYGRPGVGVAAVGPEMTKTSAEVADNLLCHSFTTPRYLREVTIPSIEKVLAAHGRTRAQLRLVGMPFIAFGETEEELDAAIRSVKEHIAFYSSTPAYVGVLAAEGLDGAHPDLLRMSKAGEWDRMGDVIDDAYLRTFAVVGDAQQCAEQLKQRFEGIFDLICGYASNMETFPVPILQKIKAMEA